MPVDVPYQAKCKTKNGFSKAHMERVNFPNQTGEVFTLFSKMENLIKCTSVFLGMDHMMIVRSAKVKTEKRAAELESKRKIFQMILFGISRCGIRD